MYFFALSQAPPVFDAEIAIWTPLTNAPGKSPATAYGPNNIPKKIGVKITNKPGAIISCNEAWVEIWMHALKSGSTVPAYIPGFSLNYLLTSSTICNAAFPTDFIVNAENA